MSPTTISTTHQFPRLESNVGPSIHPPPRHLRRNRPRRLWHHALRNTHRRTSQSCTSFSLSTRLHRLTGQQMTPEQRKKFDAQAQERMDDKQRLFEHLKYNMNSDKPGKFLLSSRFRIVFVHWCFCSLWVLRDRIMLIIVWDVQWDKLRDDKPRSEYPPVRTVVPPPRKREGKGKAAED